MTDAGARSHLRRARPLLGTLVEVGIARDDPPHGIDAAFDAIESAQRALSRFDADSDIARFNSAPPGTRIVVRTVTRDVLRAAGELASASDGLFDISTGTGADGWSLEGETLVKHRAPTCLDLGGVGKGHAVDLAIDALVASGCAAGWVNAGGDLRVYGPLDLPVRLRDEELGGARPFAVLRDGAFATSRYDQTSRARLAGRAAPSAAHVSVAARRCLWADALTKIVALTDDTTHPLLRRHGAQAWLH